MDLPAERSSPIVFLRPLQRFFHRRALTQEVFPVLDRRQFWMAVQPRRSYRVAVISEAFLINAALRKKVVEPKEDAAVFIRAAGWRDPIISIGVDVIFVIAKLDCPAVSGSENGAGYGRQQPEIDPLCAPAITGARRRWKRAAGHSSQS